MLLIMKCIRDQNQRQRINSLIEKVLGSPGTFPNTTPDIRLLIVSIFSSVSCIELSLVTGSDQTLAASANSSVL